MHYVYGTKGTCSSGISFDIDGDGILSNVAFEGGCQGNLIAVGKLVEGMKAEAAADILAGIDCRGRGTSCGDQLARAVRSVLGREARP